MVPLPQNGSMSMRGADPDEDVSFQPAAMSMPAATECLRGDLPAAAGWPERQVRSCSGRPDESTNSETRWPMTVISSRGPLSPPLLSPPLQPPPPLSPPPLPFIGLLVGAGRCTSSCT